MAKKKHQEHENSERWLLTYADLITLLLALFVVLWSLSKMDQRQVLESMAGVFGEDQGSQGILEGSGGAVVTGAIARSLQQQAEAKKIMDKLISQKQNDIISVSYQLGKINMTIRGDVSFESGSDILTEKVKSALATVEPYLKEMSTYPIEVDGHSDDIPIHTDRFPSNLHLSTGRALKTAEFLISIGIEPKRITVQGFADNKPVVPNTSKENRQKNRRIEIALITGESSKPAVTEEGQ